MKTIYIDTDFRCHAYDHDGTLTALETDFFDGKCNAFIEGYRLIPAGESWKREDGQVFEGEMIAPWRDYELLAEFQALYEEEQAKQADMAAALEVLGVSE